MIIRSLRVNHIENPLGYKMDKPFLSWTAESETGKKQIAARVEISLSETFDSLEFDSGLHADISPLGLRAGADAFARARAISGAWTVVADRRRTARPASPRGSKPASSGEPWAGAVDSRRPMITDVHSDSGHDRDAALPRPSARPHLRRGPRYL